MGLVNSSLYIGKTALLTYQNALQVTGNNIANAGSTSYSRQTAILSPIPGTASTSSGLGVQMSALKRNIDESILTRLRTAVGDQQSALTEQQTLASIESLFNELSAYDLSSQLNEFFNAWADVQNTPDDLAVRDIVTQTATGLVSDIQRIRTDLLSMFDQLNQQANDTVETINNLASQIASLNGQIVSAEVDGSGAYALRDQRDAALLELSSLVNIRTAAFESGAVNVYIASEPLVDQTTARQLGVTLETVDGIATGVVRFTDDNALAEVTSGQMEGILNSRSNHVLSALQSLDQLASALIQDVNMIFSEGQGLNGLESVTGLFKVADATVALNDPEAELDLTPVNGSFNLRVENAEGQVTTTQITVNLNGTGSDMSLLDLAAAIDAVDNISASVTPEGELVIEADSGFSFTFAQDSSNVLAALGINVFFTGSDASDIAVNQAILDDPSLIAASTNGEAGDGSNAGRLSKLASTISATLGTVSLMDYYSSMIGKVAVSASAAQNAVSAADIIVGSLEAQRESVSGVNLDEESVQLMKFQRAYQGAARYISVVSDLIDELLALVQ